LTVWFGDPTQESICEEIGDDVVLMKDRRGRVIGFERLNCLSRKQQAEGTPCSCGSAGDVTAWARRGAERARL
jgi:hypothetical protein